MKSVVIGVVGWMVMLGSSAMAQAADDQGRFGIKGVGGLSCSRYLEAFQSKDEGYLMHLGWFGGYLTGVNQRMEDTFDLLPWQSVGLVSYAVADICRQAPQASVLQAMQAVIRGVKAERLTEASPMVSAKGERAEITIYQAALIRVQQALKKSGFYEGEIHGRYDSATREALERFQEAKGLTVTGLPDQRTLLTLFKKQGKGGGKE